MKIIGKSFVLKLVNVAKTKAAKNVFWTLSKTESFEMGILPWKSYGVSCDDMKVWSMEMENEARDFVV